MPQSPGRRRADQNSSENDRIEDLLRARGMSGVPEKRVPYDASAGLPSEHPQALRRETRVDAHRRQTAGLDRTSTMPLPFASLRSGK